MEKKMATCNVPGCDNEPHSRGVCPSHYARWRRDGSNDQHVEDSFNDGRTRHPLYPRWLTMRSRCNNPNHARYRHYGGRGVSVCQRWDDFWAFLEDVGEPPTPNHTLDRIDPDGDYAPGNVRWATPKEQNRNHRHGLTASQVQVIKARLGRGEGPTEIARDYPVTAAAISSIKQGVTWSDVAPTH